MSLYKPSILKKSLGKLDTNPKKTLSQNFLIDGNILQKIILGSEVTEGDFCVEIGPGTGILTEALIKNGATILAIEKDSILASRLKQVACSNLEVIEQDFLTYPLKETLYDKLRETQKAKVISNIPYHLTTPIIHTLLPLHSCISTVTLMVQKEVALRCLAMKGEDKYGALSLFVHFFSDPKYLFTVESTCFYPRPSVTSAVIQFSLHPPKTTIPASFFLQIARHVFQKRRKMLRVSLSDRFPAKTIVSILESIGFMKETRPEELSIQSFIAFCELLFLEKPTF